MKKLTTLVFALAVLAMTFVACGGETEETPPPAESSEPAAAPADSAEPAETPAEEEQPATEAEPKAQ